jgi:hypothetical protein
VLDRKQHAGYYQDMKTIIRKVKRFRFVSGGRQKVSSVHEPLTFARALESKGITTSIIRLPKTASMLM